MKRARGSRRRRLSRLRLQEQPPARAETVPRPIKVVRVTKVGKVVTRAPFEAPPRQPVVG